MVGGSRWEAKEPRLWDGWQVLRKGVASLSLCGSAWWVGCEKSGSQFGKGQVDETFGGAAATAGVSLMDKRSGWTLNTHTHTRKHTHQYNASLHTNPQARLPWRPAAGNTPPPQPFGNASTTPSVASSPRATTRPAAPTTWSSPCTLWPRKRAHAIPVRLWRRGCPQDGLAGMLIGCRGEGGREGGRGGCGCEEGRRLQA